MQYPERRGGAVRRRGGMRSGAAGATAEVVSRQLDAVLAALPVSAVRGIVVAHEPLWAIGTGRTATPAMAQDVHARVRARFAACDPEAAQTVRILGSGANLRPG